MLSENLMIYVRRHQLNHFAHAVHRCGFAGCSRTFQRPDLLARHMERQYVGSEDRIFLWWRVLENVLTSPDSSDSRGSNSNGRKPVAEKKPRRLSSDPNQMGGSSVMGSTRYAPAPVHMHDPMMLASQGAPNMPTWEPICTTAAYMGHPIVSTSSYFNPVNPLTSPGSSRTAHPSLPPDSLRHAPDDCSSNYSSSTAGFTMMAPAGAAAAAATTTEFALPPVSAAAANALPVSPLYKVPSNMPMPGHCVPSGSSAHWVGAPEAPPQSWPLADLILPSHVPADARGHPMHLDHALHHPPSSSASSSSRMVLSAGCSYQGTVGMGQDRLPW